MLAELMYKKMLDKLLRCLATIFDCEAKIYLKLQYLIPEI